MLSNILLSASRHKSVNYGRSGGVNRLRSLRRMKPVFAFDLCQVAIRRPCFIHVHGYTVCTQSLGAYEAFYYCFCLESQVTM